MTLNARIPRINRMSQAAPEIAAECFGNPWIPWQKVGNRIEIGVQPNQPEPLVTVIGLPDGGIEIRSDRLPNLKNAHPQSWAAILKNHYADQFIHCLAARARAIYGPAAVDPEIYRARHWGRLEEMEYITNFAFVETTGIEYPDPNMNPSLASTFPFHNLTAALKLTPFSRETRRYLDHGYDYRYHDGNSYVDCYNLVNRLVPTLRANYDSDPRLRFYLQYTLAAGPDLPVPDREAELHEQFRQELDLTEPEYNGIFKNMKFNRPGDRRDSLREKARALLEIYRDAGYRTEQPENPYAGFQTNNLLQLAGRSDTDRVRAVRILRLYREHPEPPSIWPYIERLLMDNPAEHPVPQTVEQAVEWGKERRWRETPMETESKQDWRGLTPESITLAGGAIAWLVADAAELARLSEPLGCRQAWSLRHEIDRGEARIYAVERAGLGEHSPHHLSKINLERTPDGAEYWIGAGPLHRRGEHDPAQHYMESYSIARSCNAAGQKPASPPHRTSGGKDPKQSAERQLTRAQENQGPRRPATPANAKPPANGNANLTDTKEL